MLGSRELAQLLADRALELLPGEVDRLAGELGAAVALPLPPGELGPEEVTVLDAKPRLYAATQLPVTMVGSEDWPFVMVVPRALSSVRALDELLDGSRVVRQTWTTRWWLYARGDGYHLTAAVRDRLTLAMMELLLRHPAWTGTTAGRSWRATVGVESMTASPADLDDGLGSVLGACWIEAPVMLDSALTPLAAPVGVSSVTSSVEVLPPVDVVNPALL